MNRTVLSNRLLNFQIKNVFNRVLKYKDSKKYFYKVSALLPLQHFLCKASTGQTTIWQTKEVTKKDSFGFILPFGKKLEGCSGRQGKLHKTSFLSFTPYKSKSLRTFSYFAVGSQTWRSFKSENYSDLPCAIMQKVSRRGSGLHPTDPQSSCRFPCKAEAQRYLLCSLLFRTTRRGTTTTQNQRSASQFLRKAEVPVQRTKNTVLLKGLFINPPLFINCFSVTHIVKSSLLEDGVIKDASSDENKKKLPVVLTSYSKDFTPAVQGKQNHVQSKDFGKPEILQEVTASRTIVITSGKGGVGKTTATANLGMSIARLGYRVALIDSDIGLRNLDLLLGLENRIMYTAMDILEGQCRLDQALIRDKRWKNLSLLAISKNRQRYNVTRKNMENLVTSITASGYHFILIDCPAGIDVGFINAISPAEEALIVTTPEITAIRDADRVAGLLEANGIFNTKLLVNRVRPDMVQRNDMMSVRDVQEMLGIPLLGVIPEDHHVIISTNRGEPLVLKKKLTLSGIAFENAARRLIGKQDYFIDLSSPYKGLFQKVQEIVFGL